MKPAKRSLCARVTALLLCLAIIGASSEIEAYAAGGVITGKDGWYYTTFDSATADYKGSNLYTAGQLQIILANFLNMRDTLEADGIEFVVFLAPNKEHVYDEYMPDSSGKLAPYTRIRQIYDLLVSNGIKVIYPEEELREAKERYPYESYYKTDSHWNGVGTYLCSKLLMEELGYEMPELEDLTVIPYGVDDKDCAQLLGRSLPDVGYTVTGYEGSPKSDKRIFICGDSFGMELYDCLAPVTDDCFIIHRDLYTSDMPYKRESNVVVYEILERFMDVIPLFSCV